MDLNTINARRSIRKYREKPVEPEKLKEVLESIRYAPSACNSQPWRFIVVDDIQVKDRLCKEAFTGKYSFNRFAAQAPVLIVAVADNEKPIPFLAGFFRKVDFKLMDITIACEHMILKAWEKGLGSCWIGWFNENAVKKALDIPRVKKVISIISLGYAENGDLKDRPAKSTDKIISFNKWRA